MNDIGLKIKIIRELKNLTQAYVAEQLEMEQSTYSKVEHSEVKIDFGVIEKIARVFGMKLNDIIDFDLTTVLRGNEISLLHSEAINKSVTEMEVHKGLSAKKDIVIKILQDKISLLKILLKKK